MVIVINILSARHGGGQTYVNNLLGNLEKGNDWEIFILTSSFLDVSVDATKVKQIAVHWINRNPFFRWAWEKIRLPGLLKKLKADILFCPGGLVSTRVPSGCRVVTMFRNMIPFDREQRIRYPLGYMRLRNWLLERGLLSSMCNADLVIFISNFARQVIESRAPDRIKKSVVIPHGTNEQFKIQNPTDLRRPDWLPKEDYLLYVSDFQDYKNHLEVAQGYALLKKLRPTPEKLVFVGYNRTRYGKKVAAEILRLGLEEDIIMAGSKKYEDLPAVYYNAKLFIFASSCENCPNILLEAMGAGRPLLVSNKQPMPEFGRDAVVYFDPVSPEDLSKKILSIINQPMLLEELSRKAKDLSRQFDWQVTSRKTWEAIASLVNKGNTAAI